MLKLLTLIILFIPLPAFAGNDASGDIPREMDLAASFTRYELQEKDSKWSKSLVKNLNYQGEVNHFVRTNISLLSNGQAVKGRVYQSVEKPDFFYVAEGDLMFKIGEPHPYSPGVSGFSMHSPESKNYIVCLNCFAGGVVARNSTWVVKGNMKWQGTKWNRL